MALDALTLLLRLTLAASAAIVLVLLLRVPLRRFGGAVIAYQCWLLVPLMMGAAALPQLSQLHLVPALVVRLPVEGAAAIARNSVELASGWDTWVARTWAIGALATLALFSYGQRSFTRGLGTLTPMASGEGQVMLAERATGPLLLGLWHPLIVVPADFTQRYSSAEQALILAHERTHAARGDPLVNAVLALLQCVFWFNPLIHYAASRCRFDQELACDALVTARHPGQRQTYAAAMLKTQSNGAPALAGCHWQSHHPLKERLMQLKQSTPRAGRRLAGRAFLAILACASVFTTVAVRADNAAPAQSYKVALKFGGAFGDSSPTLLVRDGDQATLAWHQTPTPWSSVVSVSGAAGDSVMLKLQVSENGKVVASPSLLLKLDQAGAVSLGDAGRIDVTVSRHPAP